MPEKITLDIPTTDFRNLPSPTDLKIWAKQWTKDQWNKLCSFRRVNNSLFDQTIEENQKMCEEILGIKEEIKTDNPS